MITKNLDLITQKGSRVVQMIIAYKKKSDNVVLKDESKKIKLSWQWISVYENTK